MLHGQKVCLGLSCVNTKQASKQRWSEAKKEAENWKWQRYVDNFSCAGTLEMTKRKVFSTDGSNSCGTPETRGGIGLVPAMSLLGSYLLQMLQSALDHQSHRTTLRIIHSYFPSFFLWWGYFFHSAGHRAHGVTHLCQAQKGGGGPGEAHEV